MEILFLPRATDACFQQPAHNPAQIGSVRSNTRRQSAGKALCKVDSRCRDAEPHYHQKVNNDFGLTRDRFRVIEALADNLNMSPSPSFKSKRHSKLEPNLPTYVRAPQIRRTTHTFGRMRQAAVIIGCVVVALLFGGLSYGYSVHRSQDVARNPAYLIKAKSGAVASENILCSEIGVDVMKDGGNAVDAAIATTFCTGVVNMFS